MSDSKIPASLAKELRTRYTSWTERIPPWRRSEQEVPPKTLDTLEWLQFVAHVRRETEQHGWWYHAMGPVRLTKRIWGVIQTYKKTSITIGLLGCSGWVLVGTSLNNSTDVQTIERFLTLNKIVTPATIYPSLSEQCPYSFINPITWCTYRVGNEYLEWSTPILEKIEELETLRTDIETLKNAPTSSNLDTLTALLEQHRTVKVHYDGLQSHFETHNIELTDLLPSFPINKLESLEQINIEHHKNQEALAALIEQAQQFNIEVEIEGPITNQALEEMQKLGTFLSTFDQWIERANNVERPLFHNNPFTYTFTPILNTPLETQIESTDWNGIWTPQFKEIIQLEECQFIRENTPLKDQWTEDVQQHCMHAGTESSSKFDAIYNGNTNQQRGFLSALDTAKLDDVSDIFGYATATQWLADSNGGRDRVWNVLTDTYGIENLDRQAVVAHWLDSNNTKRAWTTIGNITDMEDKHASLLLWMEYHTVRKQWSSVWKRFDETSQSETNFESVIAILNKNKAPQSQWLKLIEYSDNLSVLEQARVLVQIGTAVNTLGHSSLGRSLHHKALALWDGQNEVSTLTELISIVGSSKQQNKFPNGTRLLDQEIEILITRTFDVANSMNNNYAKANAISNIAIAQANAGLFELAIKTANSIRDSSDYGNVGNVDAAALSNIATTQAKSGFFEQAIKTANSIDRDSYKAKALSNIATVQANMGLFEHAINTANSIDHDSYKAEGLSIKTKALSNIAAVQANIGLINEAKNTLEKAVNTANSIDDILDRSEALSNIAAVQANIGLINEAKNTLEKAVNTANFIDENSRNRDRDKYLTHTEALSSIAAVQANIGLINEAQKTFKLAINLTNRDYGYTQGKALHAIATAQANAGFFKQATKTANSIRENYQANIFSNIATAQQTAQQKAHTRYNNTIYSTLQSTSVANTHYSTNHMSVTDDETALTNTLTIDSTFHPPLAWMLNPPKSQSTLPKEIVTLSKQLNLRTPPKCIRDGIDIGYTEGFITYWTDALQRQVRAEGLRDQYRSNNGDPFGSIEKWYGVIENPDRSTDPCIQPFPFPLLTTEQLDALDDELNKVERDSSKFKDLLRQAKSLSIDTSDWGAPFQFETWEAEITLVSGLNTRMTDLIKRGLRMGLNLKDSLFNDASVLAKPYTTEQTDHLQREIERIEGFIDDWNTAKRTAASVGYRFPSKPILSDLTQENLDWHNLYIPQTKAVRTIMRRISFKSTPTGSITPIGETEAIKVTKGFSISTTEIPQELYCAVLGPTKSCEFQSGYPYRGNWEDTAEFIQALSHQMGREGCESPVGCNTCYRLPTLDEWRYAALAKQQTFYAGSNIADEVAWTSQNSNKILPSALKRPNAWGIYDMSGNVSEWISSNTCAGGSAGSEARESSVMSTSGNSACGLRLVRP